MNKLRIYLAHPISGKTMEEVVEYFSESKQILEDCGYDVLYPMIGKGYMRVSKTYDPHGYEQPIATDRAIVGRDKWMVTESDIVFANLKGSTRVSIGTCCEIAWAHMLGKLVVLCIEEGNIHEHAFIMEQADFLCRTEEEAFDYLEKIGKREY